MYRPGLRDPRHFERSFVVTGPHSPQTRHRPPVTRVRAPLPATGEDHTTLGDGGKKQHHPTCLLLYLSLRIWVQQTPFEHIEGRRILAAFRAGLGRRASSEPLHVLSFTLRSAYSLYFFQLPIRPDMYATRPKY